MSGYVKDSRNVATVKEYFVRGDAGCDDIFDLLSDDFKFYFPKFGLGSGKAEFKEFVTGLMSAVKSITHDIGGMKFFEGENIVVVEGVTRGVYHDGTSWSGGETPGGRFCSIYEFSGDGLIKRMHIYVDPDYTSRDKDRFLWLGNRQW
ncbi:nuclear transport factor 2 family protein [Trinickia symbiotica]|uniref:nuclear transport factor 2 family protein n=1 Tax=Trinickia symbiotica TaxID=863227 RepID=UPI000363CA14|nr:nuclear transport factor 2 family protein [Trinickia symbiotica]